jgi:hypothetical protein
MSKRKVRERSRWELRFRFRLWSWWEVLESEVQLEVSA